MRQLQRLSDGAKNYRVFADVVADSDGMDADHLRFTAGVEAAIGIAAVAGRLVV